MGNSGWNRPAANQPTVKKDGAKVPSAFKGIAAGLIIAVLSVVCYFVFFYSDVNCETGSEGSSSTKIKLTNTKTPGKPQRVNPLGNPKGRPTREDLVALRPNVGDTNVVLRKDIPAPVSVDKPNGVDKIDRRMFKTTLEQVLGMAFADDPTQETPPLPIDEDTDLSQEEVESGLAAAIKAEDGDSEAVLERKMIVLEMKDEFRTLQREGWTFAQYARELQHRHNLNAAFYAEACGVAEKAYHDSTIDDNSYLSLRSQINEKLAERGLPALPSDSEDRSEEEEGSGKDS